MNAVELTDISKKYGKFHLKDITFSLEEGSVLGIIGENGAGKTTMVKILLGMIQADRGSVSVLGCDDLRRAPKVRSRIGFVMNEAGFPDALNGKDMNSILKDTYETWDEPRFLEIMKTLDGDMERPYKNLSMGNRMKLLIAACLAHNPDLTVMDEATNFLDPAARSEVINMLNDYTRDEHKTLVLSSHITNDLEKIADYILFLYKGEILMYAPKDEILDQYRYVTAPSELISEMNEADVIGRRDTGFGTDALIRTQACTDGMQIRNATLEEIFTALVKGVI